MSFIFKTFGISPLKNAIKNTLTVVVVLVTSNSSLSFAAPPFDDVLRAQQDPNRFNTDRLIHKDINTELDVPPVFQRPLGVDAGERIHVRRFEVKGVIDHPDFGINETVVADFVERLRIDIQNLDAMNKYGLSEDDMNSMAKQIQETLYSDDADAIKKLDAMRKKIREAKRYREEMSIGQLQEVANKLTDFYRQSGLVIAQVFVPEQTVEDGVVKLHVLEGNLGGTVVVDNEDYSAELLKSPFTHLEHKPVTKSALENALLELSDFPGVIAYGVLQPGKEQGETDLLVKVQEEIKHEYSFRADNYGSESTGKNRLTFGYSQNNVFGNADVFSANLLHTLTPANTIFGGIDYVTPIGFSGYDFGAGFSTNAFDVGGDLASFDISGTVVSYHFLIGRQMERSRRSNYSLKADFTNKVAETTSGSSLLSKDIISAVGFEYSFDNLDVVNQGINQGALKLVIGLPGVFDSLDDNSTTSSRTSGEGNIATSEYAKLTWSIARLQLISKYQNVLFKTTGQYTPDLLPPVEQFGMGGPNNVRAFSTSEYLRDSAATLSVDWNFNAPGFYDKQAFDGWKWGEILQMTLFADFATGIINEPVLTDDTPLNIGGVGIATQLLLPGKLTLRLDISSGVSTTKSQDGSTQFYLTFSYTG